MLRITVEEKPDKIVLHLEGKLAGPWVHELQSLWNHLQPLGQNRFFVVDLLRATYLDIPGRNLLLRMHQQGARFEAAGPMIASIVDEICRTKANSPG